MKVPLAPFLLLLHHAALGISSPTTTTTLVSGQAATADGTNTRFSTTTSHFGQDAAAAAAANEFLALVEGWQHRRASGYYVLADACGDVIAVYHEPSHVRLAGCRVTQCTEALRDGEAETVRAGAALSSSTTWCDGTTVRSADSVTSLLGHLRCLASVR